MEQGLYIVFDAGSACFASMCSSRCSDPDATLEDLLAEAEQKMQRLFSRWHSVLSHHKDHIVVGLSMDNGAANAGMIVPSDWRRDRCAFWCAHF